MITGIVQVLRRMLKEKGEIVLLSGFGEARLALSLWEDKGGETVIGRCVNKEGSDGQDVSS